MIIRSSLNHNGDKYRLCVVKIDIIKLLCKTEIIINADALDNTCIIKLNFIEAAPPGIIRMLINNICWYNQLPKPKNKTWWRSTSMDRSQDWFCWLWRLLFQLSCVLCDYKNFWQIWWPNFQLIQPLKVYNQCARRSELLGPLIDEVISNCCWVKKFRLTQYSVLTGNQTRAQKQFHVE